MRRGRWLLAAAVGLAGCGDDAPAAPASEAEATFRLSAEDATQDYGDLLGPEDSAGAAGRAQFFAEGVRDREEPMSEAVTVRAVAVQHHGDGGADALVEVRGLADDAIGGYDLTLTIVADGDRYRITKVVQRTLCSRGVSDDTCV